MTPAKERPPEGNGESLEALLEFLRDQRGFDFTGYKRNNLQRRIGKRMSELSIDSYDQYREHLELQPDEFPLLFNTILISVTSFFRDPERWDALAGIVIPRILEDNSGGEPIRAWVAGCATGEEAYTLAMLLVEAMGERQFLERVKIYASDVDGEGLATARSAGYPPAAMNNVPEELREKYFEKSHRRHVFRKDLRRSVVFGALDLVNDAPISHVDLITCRNTLMYFNGDLQNRILARFHFALNDPGFLFLGKAEMLLRHGDLFGAIDLKHRIFEKVPKATLNDRFFVLSQSSQGDRETRKQTDHARLRTGALEADAYSQVVVDHAGRIALINDQAKAMFDLDPMDMGRLFQDLQLSYRPTELRSVIEEVRASRVKRRLNEIERPLPDGTIQYLDIAVSPVQDEGNRLLGVNLTFLDVTETHQLRDQLKRSNQELETAYEELQSTNEELETTNEELQSTIEELETTNEELQSSNEELQTMNEELQSSNEELHTINDTLQDSGDQLVASNAFLDSLVTSLHLGVAIVDENLEVVIWNARAEDLWGLRSEEVMGRPLSSLDIGLPIDPILERLGDCLKRGSGGDPSMMEASNRRGQRIACRVHCMPFRHHDGDIGGAIVTMEEMES